jgi:hypothetical protein
MRWNALPLKHRAFIAGRAHLFGALRIPSLCVENEFVWFGSTH